MTTWILRISPEELDLDALLKEAPAIVEIPWKRRSMEMREGDQVFLWRGKAGKASDAKLSGIVAEAFITSVRIVTPERREHPVPFPDMSHPEGRIGLRIARVELRERLRGNWFANDPVMSQSMVVKSDTGSEFLLSEDQAARVNALWRRAKTEWTYAENVAGIWAFKNTHGAEISRLPGSPVAIAALRTGRIVQGMYNRVQHYRALDPNDSRTGLPSVSLLERRVWNDFFDANENRLRGDDIEAEFARLWPEEGGGPLPPQPRPEIAAATLIKLPIEQLLARYAISAEGRSGRPRTYRSATTAFDRDPAVVAIAIVRSGRRCEVPGCLQPLFRTVDGQPFVEVHHIVPLAEGGDDTPENVACVCPNHHREAHHGTAAADIKAALLALRAP